MPEGSWRSGDTITITSDRTHLWATKQPAEARPALEQFQGSAHDALAQNETDEYENLIPQTLVMNEGALGAGQVVTAKVFWRRDSVLKPGTVQFRPNQLQQALNKSRSVCRSPMPNRHFHREARLYGGVAIALLATTPACRHSIPVHLRVEPNLLGHCSAITLPVSGSSARPGA